VLLVCFDVEGSGPLHAARPALYDSSALALLLSRQATNATARITRPEITARAPTTFADPDLERLRQTNPSARGLPLFAALAKAKPAQVIIASGQGHLALTVEPLIST
jgi:hypothetical protein